MLFCESTIILLDLQIRLVGTWGKGSSGQEDGCQECGGRKEEGGPGTLAGPHQGTVIGEDRDGLCTIILKKENII